MCVVASFSFFISLLESYLGSVTRLAAKQSYYLPLVRTNYGKFNIRFQGPSIWNCIDKDKKLSSKTVFKKKIQAQYLKKY